MGSREPCRRLEAVLGALYDLGEEPGDRGAAKESKASAGAAEEKKERWGPQPAADSAGGEAGGRRRARDFFGELRAELGAAAVPPPPAAPPAVEVVVFRGRKRRGQPDASVAPSGGAQTKVVDEQKNVNEQEFNFEKARLEVHKFGITGYKKQEQRIWEQERAIMLGAKPLKKEHMSYKTFQEKLKEKKTVKEDDKGKEHNAASLKKKRKKKEQKERKAKRKKSVPSIWPAGQVGKFRDGTLILQSCDIKKIKSSKVVK